MPVNKRWLLFAITGSLGFGADAVSFSLLHYGLVLPLMVARVLSFVLSATATWYDNRRFTFKSDDLRRFRQWCQWMLGESFSALPNFVMFRSTIWLLGDGVLITYAALVLSILVGMVSNFLIGSKVVFAPPSNQLHH